MISICIPTYNQRADFLRAAINSALKQSYSDVEVVVSDNHSTNDVPRVLAEFSDQRLRVVRPPTFLSMAANFAYAASQIRGDPFCFLSSDDLLHPECCARLMPIIEKQSAIAFVHCPYLFVNERAEVTFAPRTTRQTTIRRGSVEINDYVFGNKTWIIGALIRQAAYRMAGGIDERIVMGFDWHLALKLMTVGDVGFRDEVLASIRQWVDPERRLRFISTTNVRDIQKIYNLLSTPVYIQIIRGGEETIKRARRFYAVSIARGMLRHNMNREQYEQVANEIKQIDSSLRVRILLNIGRSRVRIPIGYIATAEHKLRVWSDRMLDRLGVAPIRL